MLFSQGSLPVKCAYFVRASDLVKVFDDGNWEAAYEDWQPGAEALRILGELYPDKDIIPVNGEILAVIGGGIHCVTQQQPIFGTY